MTPLNFPFLTITSVNINGFLRNLVCALILWGSGLGLLIGKFSELLTELSASKMSIFFSDNNFSKYQLIFKKLAMCIDIVKICFGTAIRPISSIFRVICLQHYPYFCSQTVTWVFIKLLFVH